MATSKSMFWKPDDTDLFTAERESQIEDQTTSLVFNANRSLNLVAQRKRLPIARYKTEILYCLENFQTLVIVGECGSGKSTQIPQFLYEHGWHSKGLIGITQPRRISAITLATRVSEEMGDVIGSGSVGVAVRFLSKCSGNTKIKYMTEGILLREILANPLLSQYSIIMIDEAHERSVLTDCVLGLLKKIAKKRSSFKIIISSATLDADLFSDFFNFKTKQSPKDTSMILTVEGRMYENPIFYLQEPCADYVRETVNTVIKIHSKEAPGDILAFLTGQEEVYQAINMLRDHMELLGLDETQLKVLPMHGSLTHHDQLRVFFHTPRSTRKVIIATNIAETSVTIPGIAYVVDCGFIKLKWYVAEHQMDMLIIVPASQACCRQRAGRAGRTKSGKVFRLFTEEHYNQLPIVKPPEMRRTDLSMTILSLKALGIDNILRFNFPSPPPAKNMLASIELLHAYGALDGEGQLNSPDGYMMAEMPLNPALSKMLLASCDLGCSDEILSIVAMMQVQQFFSRPNSGQGAINARRARRNFEVAEGDLITMLNVYNAFVSNGCTKEFCGQYHIMYRHLKRVVEIRNQLASIIVKQFKLKLVSCGTEIIKIQKAITAGLFPFAAYLHHSGSYRMVRGDCEVSIHPTSCLYTEKQPSWIVFAEVLHTTKLFVKDITVIDSRWLLELAPHYFDKSTARN
ncbi:CLUMA_CG004811, isoform A [Clunio marinus]|uniref:RNA helicase n=1 Tax=Clunio marinus TaxID=568069 RepID=A0A1J1HT00_9DIPT|nr:CLUMA_CG004811, isoform A [Clunio marinus]